MSETLMQRISEHYDPAFYRERVNRNEVFLGPDRAQMQASQDKISNAVVGVAGQGALGGNVAMIMARLGVRHLKIADHDDFDISNINRQLGATPDVTVDVYAGGIQVGMAEDFVQDCDLIIDCIDLDNIDERYALHKAFRASPKCKGCLTSKSIGFGANLCLFNRDGLTLEDLYGIAAGTEMTDALLDHLVRLQASFLPRFPSLTTIYEWMAEKQTAPTFATTPSLSQHLVVSRASLMLCDLDIAAYCEPLPPMPNYLWMDATTMTCQVGEFDGRFANEGEFETLLGNG